MGNSKNKETPIESVKDFIEHANKILKEYHKAVRKYFLFRGQEDSTWSVTTSAYRRLENTLGKDNFSEEYEINYNKKLIEDYEHEDFYKGNSSQIIKKNLGILAQLQHDGAATSLIDFTANSLVALWFACRNLPNQDGKVFILAINDSSLFDEIKEITRLEKYPVDNFKELGVHQSNELFNEKWIYWKPANINNRIVAQQSYFLIGRRELPEMKQITIPAESKNNILQELSVLHSIKETTLFPDAMGFAQANSVESSYDAESQDAQNERTIRLYDKKIETDPNVGIDYFHRGLAKYSLEDYRGFIEDFDMVIKYYPDFSTAYFNRAAGKRQIKNFIGAISDYNKTIELDPKNADAYNNRGYAKIALKDYKGAVDDVNKALKIDPQNKIFCSTRGEAYEKLYKKTKEEVYRRKAIVDYKKTTKFSDHSKLDEFQSKALKISEQGLKRLENNPQKN